MVQLWEWILLANGLNLKYAMVQVYFISLTHSQNSASSSHSPFITGSGELGTKDDYIT